MTDEETQAWFEAEFERIRAGRTPLISLRNVRYTYAAPGGGSIGIEAISASVDANTCKA